MPLAILELIVPVVAEMAGSTPSHPEHLVERFGLFTIIVLGESVLATSLAIQQAIDLDGLDWGVATIVIGGLLSMFSIWWIYFGFRDEDGPVSPRRSFVWSYGHFLIWAAIAAVGVGVSVAIDVATDHAKISTAVAGAALAVPVAIFLASMWAFHDLGVNGRAAKDWITLVAAGLVLLTPLTPEPVLLTGLILVGLVATRINFQGFRRL